ncbi:MAG: hypothetical protein MMC23_006003 [Stictis urceolatum]|nr:hypothetical protein [Stictis urceolata]
MATNGTTTPSYLRTSLERDGFALIPSILSSSQLTLLRNACSHATTLARTGQWPHIRTLPKQFPPWPSDPSHGIWGVQHLLHPSMPHQEVFAASYFSSQIAGVVTELMKCSEGELVMELYNLLVRPDEDFELRWHRDDIPSTASREEEERRLCASAGNGEGEGEREYLHAQWNLALFEDQSLVVVPGSHRRARTEAEREAGPYQAVLEGMKVVELQPGDVVFYDNNILHRGVYSKNMERMTLHGSVGRSGRGEERARNVLQHGVGEWVGRCDFGGLEGVDEGMGMRAERMRERLVEIGKGKGKGMVGFSQPD